MWNAFQISSKNPLPQKHLNANLRNRKICKNLLSKKTKCRSMAQLSGITEQMMEIFAWFGSKKLEKTFFLIKILILQYICRKCWNRLINIWLHKRNWTYTRNNSRCTISFISINGIIYWFKNLQQVGNIKSWRKN